jgi:hypothetical protein
LYLSPPGDYIVEMLLHDPNRELHTPDGTVIGPYSVGFHRTKMTVE